MRLNAFTHFAFVVRSKRERDHSESIMVMPLKKLSHKACGCMIVKVG